MSADAIGWVFKHSPYKGAAFSVHLALADSANDMHGYELWARQGWVSAKARLSRQATNEALGRMVDDGLLELLEDNGAHRKPNRYRFLMPSLPVAFDMSPQATRHVNRGDTNMSTEATQNPRDNPKGYQTTSGGCLFDTETPNTAPTTRMDLVAAGFSECWAIYPKNDRRKEAFARYRAAVRSGVSPGDLLRATRNYADAVRGSIPKYILSGPTFYGPNERWVDYLEAQSDEPVVEQV